MMRNDVGLTHSEIRRLGKLRKLHPDPYECAWAILEYCEAREQPIDAMATAESMVFEIERSSGESFWSLVAEALETIRDEDDAEVTIYYSDGGENGDPQYPYTIGRYHDDTEGDFEIAWIPTDAWRGYYEVRPSAKSDWVAVHDDVILAWSRDAEDLEAMDKILRRYMDAHEIRYARAFARSSNLFSTGYTLFVPKEHVDELVGFIENLKFRFRDDLRFAYTAIFGKVA